MRAVAIIFVISCWIGAAFGAAQLSRIIVEAVEQGSVERVALALDAAGHDWAEVSADGLEVTVRGAAPDTPARLRALDVAARSVPGEAVRDETTVLSPDAVRDIALDVTILRAPGLITLIGSGVRTDGSDFDGDPLSLLTALQEAAPDDRIVSLMSGPAALAPKDWDVLSDAAARAAGVVETANITISTRGVHVQAMAQDVAAAQALEMQLNRVVQLKAPFELTLDITAPEPIIPRHMLIAEKGGNGYVLTDCTLPNEDAQIRLSRLLDTLGADENSAICQIGGGAPEGWVPAAEAVLAALDTVRAGDVALLDTRVVFHTDAQVTDERRDAARVALTDALPDGFALLPLVTPEAAIEDAPEASPLTLVLEQATGITITGQLPSDGADAALTAFAQAQFGNARVERDGGDVATARLSDSLAVADALSRLTEGEAQIGADYVTITGIGGRPDLADALRNDLAAQLGPEVMLELNVAYEPAAQPANAPQISSRVCERQIAAILEERQIAFAPSSAVIDDNSARQLDRIAETLMGCKSARIIIAGYTDDRGGEDVNLAISSARAESVLDALLRRGVFLDRMRARGYGEADAIADNETEEGRAANRRIEIRVTGADE